MDSNVTKSDRTAAARLLANKQPSTVPAPENTLMYALAIHAARAMADRLEKKAKEGVDVMAAKKEVKQVGADVIQVYSGRLVDLNKFHVTNVGLCDIAHSLSQLCRFGGHTREFYSVAQHSVLVEQTVAYSLDQPDLPGGIQLRKMALLHDAHEAYLGDIVRPLKSRFRDLEAVVLQIDASIATALGVWRWHRRAYDDQEMIRMADGAVLMAEKRDLLLEPDVLWPGQHEEPIQEKIEPWSSGVAKTAFLERWLKLCRLDCGVPGEVK